MPERKNILALYDCRSKQEYIYRTNRVQEITGASELLRSLFTDFFKDENNGFRIKSDWRNEKAPESFLDVFNDEAGVLGTERCLHIQRRAFQVGEHQHR